MASRHNAASAAAAVLMTAVLGGAGPAAPPAAEVAYLDQGWTEAGRRWFYHADQGTRAMPMAWFRALEAPFDGSAVQPLVADPANLGRLGFLPDPVSGDNPLGLPVGFAEDKGTDGQQVPMMGLTCAACHTGQVEYRGVKLRIDGGPAVVDIDAFQTGLGLALAMTAKHSERFERFADRVLGPSDPPELREGLRRTVGAQAEAIRIDHDLSEKLKLHPVQEGAGRLDALGRGGNLVFGEALRDRSNLAPTDAPVSFPGLWDTGWFKWAQYNGSISQPMARNVAEALGVRAEVDLGPDEATRFASSVRLDRLYEMEQLLAGKEPGNGGLRAPSWPRDLAGLDAAWRIDDAKAQRGKEHFARLCAGCHEARPGQSDLGRPETRLTMVDLRLVGTDPAAATNFAARTVRIPWEPGGPVPAAEALRRVTNGVMNRWYSANGTRPGTPAGPEERWAMGGRSDNEWQAPARYRARPLHGVWATAPYLHNGSVPNLYELLLPAYRRSASFHAGGREFDPRRVGFDTSEAPGRTLLDTTLPGNSNRGHEFRDGPRGDGAIGPALTDEQRWDLLEYLKTL
jgi:mono/diheme cytochrome c family protein